MALDPECLSRVGLRDLASAVLRDAAIVAADKVRTSHAQPSAPEELPEILVATPAERKDTLGTGAPAFTTTITLAVMVRVSGRPRAGVDDSETDAEMQLDALIEQVQQAILCTPAMVEPVERFEFVETMSILTIEGEDLIGEATIMFGCRVRQIYEPDAGDPFLEMVMTVPAGADARSLTVDIPLPQ